MEWRESYRDKLARSYEQGDIPYDLYLIELDILDAEFHVDYSPNDISVRRRLERLIHDRESILEELAS